MKGTQYGSPGTNQRMLLPEFDEQRVYALRRNKRL